MDDLGWFDEFDNEHDGYRGESDGCLDAWFSGRCADCACRANSNSLHNFRCKRDDAPGRPNATTSAAATAAAFKWSNNHSFVR
jgi:hypothetical protein